MPAIRDRVLGNDIDEEYTKLEDSPTCVGSGLASVGTGLDKLLEVTVATGPAGVLEVPWIESEEEVMVIEKRD